MKRDLDEAAAEEIEAQEELFEPLTAEECAEARESLGNGAGPLTVLRHARESRKKGRTPGSRNKRTADTIAYLSQFGPDPAVAMMKIIGEDELAMVELSRQIDPTKKQLSVAEARAMRIRCMETMMPYFHGKQPVQVDATIRGILVREEIGDLKEAKNAVVDGVLGVLAPDDDNKGDSE